MSSIAPGEVVLVGGGPGDPDLLTLGGLKALRDADVVLYDHLAPLASLDEARPEAVLVDVGKIPYGQQTPQEATNALLVEHARCGRRVVRFKGGDPFVLGRGFEEALACAAAGVPVRVIPGVSSCIAGPELAGIPVTHRGVAQGFTVVSGHLPPGHPCSSTDWDAVARLAGTKVILMGVHRLGPILDGLVARGLDPDAPAAVVSRAACSDQRVVRATASTLADAAGDVALPALIVIGETVALSTELPRACWP